MSVSDLGLPKTITIHPRGKDLLWVKREAVRQKAAGVGWFTAYTGKGRFQEKKKKATQNSLFPRLRKDSIVFGTKPAKPG